MFEGNQIIRYDLFNLFVITMAMFNLNKNPFNGYNPFIMDERNEWTKKIIKDKISKTEISRNLRYKIILLISFNIKLI